MKVRRAVITQSLALECEDEETEMALMEDYRHVPLAYCPRAKKMVPKPRMSIKLGQRLRDRWVLVPRDLELLRQLSESGVAIHDEQPRAESGQAVFLAELDASRKQIEAVEACRKALTSFPYGGGAILSLPPGYGKTVCALYLTTLLSRFPLILVHTRVLAEQWKSRIMHYVQGARPIVLSTSPSKLPDAGECTHVIALLQTVLAMAQSGLTTWVEAIDMVVVDETHHLCANTLSQVMAICGARFRLGLSATIERKDGLHTMLTHLIGPIAYQTERHEDPGVTVYTVNYRSEYPGTSAQTPIVQCVQSVVEDPERTALVVKLIRACFAQGRSILVMSERRAHLSSLQSRLGEVPTEMVVGGAKPGTSRLALGSPTPIILATYAYASEGMDIPALDTCILASPRATLKQCIGRILRGQGIHNPWVFDIIDRQHPVLVRQFYKRRKFYLSELAEGGLGAHVTEAPYHLCTGSDTNASA